MPQEKLTLAQQYDRHDLYEQAVQAVDVDCDFIVDTFQTLRQRKPHTLREDFCGTAAAACEWVTRGRQQRAVGVDIDPDVLRWGQRHHVDTLTRAQQNRIELVQSDVLKVTTMPVDIAVAMNFSYWFFQERRLLKRYFKKIHHALVDDGIFFLDAFGGYDCYQEIEEPRDCDGFTYIWDQAEYDPITGEMTCYIHFDFPDGSRMERAFSYTWRLWTLPELREILTEAGFSDVTVYWQGTDEETGEGNGEFWPAQRGEADPAWIAYLIAEK